MMDWASKRVLIIGAARQGIALARYLVSLGCEVTITDLRGPEALVAERLDLSGLNITWALGGHPVSLLDGCDLVCPSGGVPLTIPLIIEARKQGIPLSNDSQFFLEAAPCPVIGITGSAGKTTTTTLVGRMIEAALGRDRTWIGGNIGNPLISDLESMGPEDMAVMELSSFQLEIMTRAPHIAAILNVTPNHLDRHVTMAAYTHAKSQILRHQGAGDIAILGCEDPGSWDLRGDVVDRLAAFGFERPSSGHPGAYLEGDQICLWDGHQVVGLLPRDIIALRGAHNLLNVLAACAIAWAAEIPLEAMQAGIEGFAGVAHRLEFVRTWGGADWINDSIATAPERAIAAIHSFEQPLVLLAGGRDKDLPWDSLAALVKARVDHLIIFGEARHIVSQAIGTPQNGSRPYSVDVIQNLAEAVQVASQVVEPGDVVLLSPGGTSFDEFRDFADRGDWFRTWVKNLP